MSACFQIYTLDDLSNLLVFVSLFLFLPLVIMVSASFCVAESYMIIDLV
jgi:hypothetical protein